MTTEPDQIAESVAHPRYPFWLQEWWDRVETWRHANGEVRVDHMDSRPGDYFGPARNDGSDDA